MCKMILSCPKGTIWDSLCQHTRTQKSNKCKWCKTVNNRIMMVLQWKHLGKWRTDNATCPSMSVREVRGLNCLQTSQNSRMNIRISFGNFLSEPLWLILGYSFFAQIANSYVITSYYYIPSQRLHFILSWKRKRERYKIFYSEMKKK